MRTIQQLPFAVLGAGAAFTVLWGVADPMAAYAEVKVVEADGYYIMGDGPEENQAVAEERARVDARRAAIEQAGICVESLSDGKMSKLTKDEIRTISANVLEVQEAEVTSEALGGTTIQYHCHIKARVDTSNITQQLQQDRWQLEDAARQNKELEEQFARVHAELAELKERYKTATEAEKQEINREVKRNEDEFTAVQWDSKGRELNNKKDYHGAIECLQKSIELAPKYAAPWSDMGYAYNDLGNYDKAIECYQKAIELDPKDATSWNNMGIAYKNLSNDDKAIECYRKSIELAPKIAITWYNMGYVYDDLGNYDKAIECLQKSIEIAPKDATAWNDMGFSYNKLGNYDKAIECCQKAIELDPKFANPWKHMGTSYYQLGNYEKAVECFRIAIRLDPDYEGAKEGLALAQAKL